MKESKKSFQRFLLVSVALCIALLIGIFTDGVLQLAEARTITVDGTDYTTVPRDCLASDSNGNNKGLYAVYSDGTIMPAEGPIDHGPRTAGGSAPCYYQDQLGLWAGKWGIWGIFDETLTGYVYAPTTGTYKFLLSADDQAWLTFNGAPFITTPYNGHAIATINLVGGTWYPIKIIFQNRGGSNWFSFWWNVPDNPQPILTKVGIYFKHDTTLSGHPGYPTTDTPVTVRAIVWAKDSPNGVEKPYTKENWPAREWYNPGVDGATVNFNPTAQNLPAIAEWPSNWPQIDFEWKALFHKADTKNTIGYNKNYEYKEYTNLFWSGGWGYDNTLPAGTWRFKVKAILNKGTQDEQSVDSLISNNINLPKEYATRISVLDNNLNVVYGLNYLKWLTAYLGVPYEWGGQWFGGKEGQNVGGADTYDDFATDCSGLVSCGARWSGYNWNSGGNGLWRATTWSLANGLPGDTTYYSSIIDKKLLAPGDILNRVTQYITLPNGKKKKLGGHVVSIYNITSYKADGTPDKIIIISAEGAPLNRVFTQEVDFKKYDDEKYITRRLTQH